MPPDDFTVAVAVEAVPRLALRHVEAARSLGISPRSLTTIVQKGLIRPRKVPGMSATLYPVNELRRFLGENHNDDGN